MIQTTTKKKYMMRLTKIFVAVFVILIGYVIVSETVLIPHEIAARYTQKLNPGLADLKIKFNAVSKSTEADIYNDPYADTSAARTQLLATQQLIINTNQALDAYDKQANMLPKSLFGFGTKSYHKAEVTRQITQDVFLQSRSILTQYNNLNNYLIAVNNARIVFKNNTSDINDLTNLSQLSGKGSVITSRADQVGQTVQTVNQMKPPAGFESYHATLLAALKQSQSGLKTLATGVNASDDGLVNSGISTIESAVTNLENQGAQQFGRASTDTVVLKNASALSDKIDSLQPFAEQ